MVLIAHPVSGIPISPSCALYLPRRFPLSTRILALPDDSVEGKKYSYLTGLSHGIFDHLSVGSYLVLSHADGKLGEEDIAALSPVFQKDVHIVLEGGLLENQYAGAQKELVERLRLFENTFSRSCSLLVSRKSLPWSMMAPFVLKLMLQMKEGTTLFLDPGREVLPSTVLADIAWGLKQHAMKPVSHVTFAILFRQGVVPTKEGLLEIPFFQEMERIQCELQAFPEAEVACVQKEEVRPLFSFLQSQFLKQAIEQKMSVRSLLRMTLRQELKLPLAQMEELEEELYELEKTFLAQQGEIPQESSFHALLESILLQKAFSTYPS